MHGFFGVEGSEKQSNPQHFFWTPLEFTLLSSFELTTKNKIIKFIFAPPHVMTVIGYGTMILTQLTCN